MTEHNPIQDVPSRVFTLSTYHGTTNQAPPSAVLRGIYASYEDVWLAVGNVVETTNAEMGPGYFTPIEEGLCRARWSSGNGQFYVDFIVRMFDSV